ncbi:MAG: DUF2256 domain-containing protein [Phormidesmis sp.]
MSRQRKKSDLPTKLCPVCGRPFAWRKKWESCWDEVKYCSDRCRRRRNQAKTQAETSEKATGSKT